MSIDLLELDLASEAYRQTLASLQRRHGAPLARMTNLFQRVFLLRSPWAPGLCFVGAQATAHHVGGKKQLMSFGGCALSLEGAFASCFGEAADRLSQVERAGDVSLTASLTGVEDRVSDGVAQFARIVLEHCGSPGPMTCDWLAGVRLDGAATLVAADWCIRRALAGPLAIPGAALSVGCAAGASLAETRERALLELVERDSVSLWWDGGRPGLDISCDALPDAREALAKLRGQDDTRKTALIDLTTDLRIPVVAAYSTDRENRNFVCGSAARASLDAAASAALVEMCQLEVGLQLAALKQAQLGAAALGHDDRNHLRRAAQVEVTGDPRFAPDPRFAAPAPRGVSSQRTDARAVVNVRQMLEQAGIEAALVDLTRPDIGIAVIKAVAPELQLAPRRTLCCPAAPAAICGPGIGRGIIASSR